MDLSKPDEFMASGNVHSLAFKHGWYTPGDGSKTLTKETDTSDFDFFAAYG
jgi:hypothetical protein